jgi:hypothetical protein
MNFDKQHLLPEDEMYSIVRLDYWKPPGDDEAAVKAYETDSLDDKVDSSSKDIERIAYDKYGRVYELPGSKQDTPVCVSLLSNVETPEPPSEPEYPKKIRSLETAAEIIDNPESDVLERRVAIDKLLERAKEDTSEVVEYVPRVVTALDDEDDEVREKAAVFIGKVGSEYPEEVKPAIRELRRMVEEDDNFVAASKAIGEVVKGYPEAGVRFVDTYKELIDDGRTRVRNNALAMLVDIAEEYPEEVKDRIPRYVELLEDEDNYVRYNAVSVLTRIAKREPDAVRENTSIEQEDFVDSLSSEHEPMRENSCWLLGYIGAVDAVPEMEKLKEKDESKQVREAAEASIENAHLRYEE